MDVQLLANACLALRLVIWPITVHYSDVANTVIFVNPNKNINSLVEPCIVYLYWFFYNIIVMLLCMKKFFFF